MRREFPARVKAAALKRCSHCSAPVARTYKLSASRLARPMYCTTECEKLAKAARAAAHRAVYFWTKVDKRGENDCWNWTGYRDPNGYGRYGRLLAHRIALGLAHGKIADDAAVCHSCDNPPCCNPKHLWLGTQADNVADMDQKGRRRVNPRRGAASNKSKLTAEQALYIFESQESGPLLAAKFGISKEAVGHIKRGRNWAHVTGGRCAS